MTFNTETLKRVVETSKIKAAGSKRWIAAIDKAFEGLTGGAWIVTELHDGIMVTTENGTYHANGSCGCEAFKFGQACKHRAGARLVALYREAEAAEAAPLPEFLERELARMVKPQPKRVDCAGWSI